MTSEEKLDTEQQQSGVAGAVANKRKLAAQASFDDEMDLDGFSELDKLEPAATEAPPSSQQPNTSSASTAGSSNGNSMQNGSLMNGMTPPTSLPHQHGQQGPSSSSNTSGAQPPQQQSVLQELLLTQSTSSNINSPRQQPTYSSGNFPTKSPMPHNQVGGPLPQNMSPMGMVPAGHRVQMNRQQMFQGGMVPTGHPGFDPSMSSQGGPMPPGNYMPQQGGAQSMMSAQQQFMPYQQHPRPGMYGSNAPIRLSPAAGNMQQQQGAAPNAGIRQQFNGAGPVSQPGPPTKGVRQQAPHPGMMMGVGGNAPTPPTRPMMLGQPGPMGSQNAPSFDSPSHPYHQQMMQRQAAQQQQHTEPNGYMMGPAAGRGAAGQMVGPSGPQQFIGASQQRPPMSFGPSGPQQMMHGSMDPSMVSQHPSAGQPGMMVNGQIAPSQRPTGIPQSFSSNTQQQQQSHQGMMVPQSPLGMMNTQGQMQQMNGPTGAQGRVPPTGGGGGPPPQVPQQMLAGQPQDPEKRKLIQQQLVLLLHAHKCQQREKQESQQGANSRAQCNLPYCSVMKGVLEHMVNCTAGRQCQYPHCASSRQIITHWKNCNKEDCPVCNPVKKYTNGSAADRRAGDLILNTSHFPAVTLPQQGIQGAIAQPPQNSMGVGPSSVGMNSFGSPPSQSTAVNSLLDGYTPNPFLSTNPPNKTGQGTQQMLPGQQQIGGFGPTGEGIPPPEPPSQARDWHASITPDLRNHLVGKLVKAIFPYPDPAAVHDQRIRDLLTYARKVEKDMFEAAPDKEAYYHMLAEKIYKIQKELQEKKNRRLNEQQQLQQQQQQQYRAPGSEQSSSMMDGGRPDSTAPMSVQQQQQQPLGHSQNYLKQELREGMQSQQQAMGGAQPQMLNFVESAIPPKRLKLEEPPSSTGTCSTIPCTSADAIKEEPGLTNSSSITATSSSSSSLFPPPTETRRSTTPKDVKPSTSSSAAPAVKQEPIVRDPKVFDPNELRHHLMPVWNNLMRYEPAVIPFRSPVDPKELNIPDYFDIIKNPMDLETIKNNLDQGKYKNPWEFCDHMWLMFENAWLYNRKNTKIHKWCTQLSDYFVEEINPVMRKMGYCCGQKLSFTPLVQFCFGITKNNAACVIARDQPYFMYESSSSGFGVTVAERYIYCVKCFEALPEEGINLNENTPDPPHWIPKSMFQKLKNDQIDLEPFEHCHICDRKWHRICALHSNKINPEGFICNPCRREKNRPKPENKFTAKRLPHYNVSRYIENRVNNFLRKKLTESDPAVEVIIRVLCSSDKEVEVKQGMLKKYGPEGYPDRFPYRSKAIFAFEVVKDPETGASHEVCFFGLYVQEYGTNCQSPNQRRVYIAYLDSVHFFQPRTLRTAVYYEILLGYLEYAKTHGYTMAHIWACPPSEGDDYIFHCHPPEQKIPKPKRLQDWYKTMLNNGHDEGTVYSYKDIFNQSKDDGLDTPMRLPYFEGDYWPRIIDECIVSAEKEEEQDRRTKQQEETRETTLSDDDTFQTDDGFPVKQKQQKSSKKKNNLKKSSQNSKKKGGLSTGNPVVDKLFQQLDKHRDVFFTIRLFSAQEEQQVMAEKPRIEDSDPLVSCELMDTRDNFLAKSREEHWEFSQLRRAKWSTLNFCYTLHTQEQDVKGVNYTCNVCEKPASYHCNQCDDYDLCENCRNKTDHPHEMEKLILGDDQKSADASAATRNDTVKKCITSLVHACTCRDANCRRGTCHKMKKVIQHTKHCKRRQTAGSNCAVCKQLIALCCYHAKHCTAAKCQVPFCLQIRQKLQEQKRSQNRQAERMMQRRMAKLQSVGAMNGAGASQLSQQPTTSTGHPSWTQPPQSPKQQHIVSSTMPIQYGASPMQMSSQTGMMMSPNAQQQQQIRLNGPMGYHQMHNPMGGQHMINSPPMNIPGQHQQMASGPQQQHPSSVGYHIVAGQIQQQQQPGQMMGPASLQRVSSTGSMHQQQQLAQQQMMSPNSQQITPPPYGRPGQQSQQQGGMPFGMSQQQLQQARFVPQMQQQPSQQQQQRMFQQQQQQPQQMKGAVAQDLKNSDVQLIMNRFKEASMRGTEEAFFTDLRKTPHLLNAFLKITKKQGVSFSGELLLSQQMRQGGSSTPQQQFVQPPPSGGPGTQQQQFYQSAGQQPPPGMMPPQQQQNGVPPFGSFQPAHQQQGQWMQQQHAGHGHQNPSQRNPSC